MIKGQSFQRVVLFSLLLSLFGAVSAIADSRPDWRTNPSSRSSISSDIEGRIVTVAGDGDSFRLQTRNGSVKIEAKGGVRVYYRGQAYRIRDLEPGDYVAVDLQDSSRNRLKARSVEVLQSRSFDRGRYDDRYDRNSSRLSGQVIAYDARRDLLVVRTRARGDVAVNTRELERRYGRDWSRGLSRGAWVEIDGYFNGRDFVATSVRDNRGYDPWAGRR